MAWLIDHLSQFNSPVVFCHNDLQEGNVLQSNENVLQVIDFEYGCFAERGLDLGNHMCELLIDNQFPKAPYFRLDFDRTPSREQRLQFARAYLGEQNNDAEVELLEREVYSFMLASHLQWVIWGVLQAFTPQVETNHFDYIQYAFERWRAYQLHKTTLAL